MDFLGLRFLLRHFLGRISLSPFVQNYGRKARLVEELEQKPLRSLGQIPRCLGLGPLEGPVELLQSCIKPAWIRT